VTSRQNLDLLAEALGDDAADPLPLQRGHAAALDRRARPLYPPRDPGPGRDPPERALRRDEDGHLEPSQAEKGGRGLWLARQLCDLVEVRSSDSGTAVRLRVALA